MGIGPVLSYPGAKWKAWPLIKPLIPRDITDWREPFLGGASISLLIAEDNEFHLEKMIVGDIATEIWAFWQGCKENAPAVVEKAKEIFSSWCPTQVQMQNMEPDTEEYIRLYEKAIEEGRKFWKWTQSVDCSKLSLVERAARTFLVNKISFSGMGDSGSLSKEQFMEFHFDKLNRILEAQPLLQKMDIRNCSFEETMQDVDPHKTFIFLDPPYYTQGQGNGLYGKGGDNHRTFPHEYFAEFVKSVNCRWLITYDDSIKVRRMFKGYYIKPFQLTYTLAGTYSEDSLAGEEIFIANYDIMGGESEDLMDLL